MGKIEEGILLRKSSVYRNAPQPICIFFVVIISIIIFLSSNIYYKMIFIEIWIFRRIQIKCVFWKIFDVVLYYSPWHRPLLAQPGPWREAIHCAFLSSFICSSILIAPCLLLAASLAAGVIRPTLAKVHKACALTAHVDTSRRYCPTMVPRRCSDSCLPVDRQM